MHRRMEVRPAARGWNATSAKLLARAFEGRVRIPLVFEAKPGLKCTEVLYHVLRQDGGKIEVYHPKKRQHSMCKFGAAI